MSHLRNKIFFRFNGQMSAVNQFGGLILRAFGTFDRPYKYVLFRTRNLGQHFLDISKKFDLCHK
jgi:hypothetical protein